MNIMSIHKDNIEILADMTQSENMTENQNEFKSKKGRLFRNGLFWRLKTGYFTNTLLK